MGPTGVQTRTQSPGGAEDYGEENKAWLRDTKGYFIKTYELICRKCGGTRILLRGVPFLKFPYTVYFQSGGCGCK